MSAPVERVAGDLALDAEVGRRVFGVKRLYCRGGQQWNGTNPAAPTDRLFYIPSGKPWRTHSIDAIPLPRYSTDIEAAWTVVEALRERGINLRMEMLDPLTEEFDRYTVEVGPWSLNVAGVPDGPRFTVDAVTAPLALCRAALAALGAGR